MSIIKQPPKPTQHERGIRNRIDRFCFTDQVPQQPPPASAYRYTNTLYDPRMPANTPYQAAVRCLGPCSGRCCVVRELVQAAAFVGFILVVGATFFVLGPS